jgi:hypothetical protein
MALTYGVNFSQSDIKNMLEKNDRLQNGIRNWRKEFGNAALGYQAQSSNLVDAYTDVISQAYKANLAQQNAFASAGLSDTAAKKYMNLTQQDLHNTYQQYLQNYQTDAAGVAQEYAKEVGAIDERLTARAQNFIKLYESAYDYLANELAGSTSTRTVAGTADNGAKVIYKEGKKEKPKNAIGFEDVEETIDYLKENGLEWVLDANGNMRTWNDIASELFNDDGTLNDRGVAFYDQMLNTTNANVHNYVNDKGEAIRGFDEWLSATNAELRDWYVSQDPYNYTFAGTNRGTANVMVGRESTDDAYAPYEYADDFTADMNNTLSNYITRLNDIRSEKLLRETYYEDWLKENNYTSIDDIGDYSHERTTADAFLGQIEKKKAEEVSVWNQYLDAVKTEIAANENSLKAKLGSSGYEAFRTEYKSLVDEYDKLIKEANVNDYEKSTNRINDWYRRYVNAANAYKNKISTRKTSGL